MVYKRGCPVTRLFYTDPLKAAWMAREFGVKYRTETGERIGYNFERNGLVFTYLGYPYTGEFFYISNVSLPVFEPKEGDIAWWHMEGGGRCLGETTRMLIMQAGLHSIIERDGKAFFMPEREG